MKSTPLLRVLWLTLGLCAATASPAKAQDAFKIVSIHPAFSNDLIKVGNGWRKDLPRRMQVSLQVGADTPSRSVFVKAYFYDKDDKLVEKYGAPNSIWAATGRGFEEVNLPPTLPHGKITDVFFALPEDLQAKKWTTMVVVFGDSAKVVASALPGSALAKVDFPEKAKLAPPN